FLDAVRRGAEKTAYVDDLAALPRYPVDVVVSHHFHAGPARYDGRAAGARLLLGPRYALLRDDVRDARHAVRADARRVLVTTGGGDPGGATMRVVEAVRGSSPEVEVDVVVGRGRPGAPPPDDGRVRHVVDVTDLPRRIAEADVVVTAAGTTALETAC